MATVNFQSFALTCGSLWQARQTLTTMELILYQVDAFSDKPFGGNPAAVCVLDEWLSDELMQNIAAEMNLSETAFCVKNEDKYHLRWFTPKAEVDMCGHATLATGHIYFTELNYKQESISFETKSGPLQVAKISAGQYKLSLPTDEVMVVFYEDGLDKLNIEYESVFEGKDDYLMILKNETEVIKTRPDFKAIGKLDKRGVIITAKGDNSDFVSRCFYPAYGIDEDPVTGSAHTLLTPYWSRRLSKNDLHAKQLSERGGEMTCQLKGERVNISASAITIIKGSLYL